MVGGLSAEALSSSEASHAGSVSNPRTSAPLRAGARQSRSDSPSAVRKQLGTSGQSSPTEKSPGSDKKASSNSPEQPAQPETTLQPPVSGENDAPDEHKPASQESNTAPLWLVLRKHPSATKERVSQWIGRLQTDGAGAVAELLSVAVEAVAPRQSAVDDSVEPRWITSEAVMTDQIAETVKSVEDALLQREGPVQPLLAKDKDGKKFRRRFEDLWTKMVIDCPSEIIHDTDALDTTVAWLLSLSSSKIRDLRLVAALSAYRILDGLIRVNERNRTQSVTLEKQLAIEKGRKKLVQEKVDQIDSKITKLVAFQECLANLFDDIVKGCFVLKYRDVSPEIRTLSIRSLGSWIMNCPAHFLDDSHLKYIGWILSDKDARVRGAALQTCQTLVNKTSDELFPNLEPFIDRFSSRIVQMCRDVDSETAASAVKVCHALLPLDLLEESQCDSISKQAITEDDTRIRNAAAAFVSDYLREKMKKSKSQFGILHQLMTNYFPKEVEAALLRGILNSLWSHVPELHEWSSYSALLIPQTPRRRRSSLSQNQSTKLTPEQITNLANFFLSACITVHSEQKNQPNSIGDLSGSWDSSGMTNQVGKLLPRLFAEFQSNAKITGILCQVPQYLDLDVFKTGKLESAFNEILKSLEGSLARHSASREVLAQVCRTVHFLASTEHALRSEAEASLNRISTNTGNSLHAIIQPGNKDRVTESAVSAGISRAASVVKYFPLQPEPNCVSDCVAVLTECLQDNPRFTNKTIAEDVGTLAQATYTWLYKSYKSAECSVENYCSSRDELLDALKLLVEKNDTVVLSSYSAVAVVVLVTLNNCLIVDEDDEAVQDALRIHTASTSLALMLSDFLGSLYYEIEETESVAETVLYEARKKLISAIIQACHTQAFDKKFDHLPLVGLSELMMGETDPRIFNLAKAYHQGLRESYPRDVTTAELNAIILAARYDSTDESYVGLLVSALAQRYSFSKPGHGPDKLVIRLMEHFLCPWPSSDEIETFTKTMAEACVPLIQRVDRVRMPTLVEKLRDITRVHIPDLSRCEYTGLKKVADSLERDSFRPKSIVKASQRARASAQKSLENPDDFFAGSQSAPRDPSLLRRSKRTRRALMADLAETSGDDENDENDEVERIAVPATPKVSSDSGAEDRSSSPHHPSTADDKSNDQQRGLPSEPQDRAIQHDKSSRKYSELSSTSDDRNGEGRPAKSQVLQGLNRRTGRSSSLVGSRENNPSDNDHHKQARTGTTKKTSKASKGSVEEEAENSIPGGRSGLRNERKRHGSLTQSPRAPDSKKRPTKANSPAYLSPSAINQRAGLRRGRSGEPAKHSPPSGLRSSRRHKLSSDSRSNGASGDRDASDLHSSRKYRLSNDYLRNASSSGPDGSQKNSSSLVTSPGVKRRKLRRW